MDELVIAPEPGTYVYDPERGEVGEYVAREVDRAGPCARIRPVGGGQEWVADLAGLRPATACERLRAVLGAANAGRRWGR
ncbi:hypothetical protein [Streptomyces carminius]|uniref:hypothetical protein n=1 Tax=Streptomyces carminius TaxID=2665496 RepID=UPI001E6171AB|nr:hypothetical protein [Streptomyces carminius]